MTDLINQSISNNIKKIIQVYHTFNLDFKDNICHQFCLKALLPAETDPDKLRHEDIEKEMYQSFMDERTKGEVSVASTMKNCNFKTFHLQGKTIKTKIDEKVV